MNQASTKQTSATEKLALTAFVLALCAVESELDELKAKVNGHFSAHPDQVHWGHVGDLDRILELLRQANGKE